MNLQTQIPAALWAAVADAYDAENYSTAILAAIHYVSNLIRDRAGVDGDGANLVGQALGGETPRLRVNALQTESEKNVQKGLEQILRGIYTGIRNPRSHEQVHDKKETANAIIHFIGYISNVLSASKDAFTVEAFMERISDSDFVSSQRYAELLVAEIPALRIADVLITIFNERKTQDFKKIKFVIRCLIAGLSPGQTNLYLSVVSDAFRTATEEFEIRTALQMLTPELWTNLQELPRLRIENKLIAGIALGKVLPSGKTSSPLSTWSNNFLKVFSLRGEASKALIKCLEGDADERHYAVKFFSLHFDDVITLPNQQRRAVRALANAVKNGEENVKQSLISGIKSLNEDWQTDLKEALKEETDPNNPAVLLFDGSPFLSSPANEDDDIPF